MSIKDNLVGFFISVDTAIREKSINAGRETWRGWSETTKYVHKDDDFWDTEMERDDKIIKNCLEYMKDYERLRTDKDS